MHDINDLDQRGLPGGFVASTEFVDATETQAAALGFEPAVVYVQHPIQDRTDEEMRGLADAAFEQVLRLVLQGA